MQSISLNLDNSTNSQISRLISSLNSNNPGEIFPRTANEFGNFVQGASVTLQNYIKGDGELVDTEPIPDKYKNSISGMLQSIKTRFSNPFEAVITATHPILEKLKNGQHASEYDMKKTYPFGPKSRVSRYKTGKRKGQVRSNYLIICFRWGAKGETAHFNSYIPATIYRTQTSNMEASWKTGKTHPEENSRGEMVERAEYEWKDRIDGENAYVYHKTRVWNGKQFKTRISNEGMVRMKHDTGDSEFITFRIISTLSPKDSWIRRIDAIKPIDIENGWKRTVELVKQEFEKNLEKALEADFNNI